MSTATELVLIDSTSDTLTVSWAETGAPYTLQYRRVNDENEEYTTLSESLTTPMARKRNLTGEEGFLFRAKSNSSSEWMAHSEPFHLLTQEEESNRMEAPKVYLGGSHSSLRIVWDKSPSADSYELQMREAKPGVPWDTIAEAFQGTQVRKKNLTFSHGYQFRVRTASNVFSPASEIAIALGISPGIQRWFQNCGTLLSNKKESQSIPLSEALGGKEFVLLYASAHWCGPCRQFTPRLAQWYGQQRQDGLVEVVFLSADHDEDGFSSYFQSMPWLAVDYDGPREELMAQIKVSGIPRLVVLDGKSGRILVDNAVGQPLDTNAWRKLAAGK